MVLMNYCLNLAKQEFKILLSLNNFFSRESLLTLTFSYIFSFQNKVHKRSLLGVSLGKISLFHRLCYRIKQRKKYRKNIANTKCNNKLCLFIEIIKTYFSLITLMKLNAGSIRKVCVCYFHFRQYIFHLALKSTGRKFCVMFLFNTISFLLCNLTTQYFKRSKSLLLHLI